MCTILNGKLVAYTGQPLPKKMEYSIQTRATPRIPTERPAASLYYSGLTCRMGSALSGRKMIRGY